MTWQRAPAAAAVVAVLADVDETVQTFAAPPSTFNPPAFIVGYPRRVQYDGGAAFGVDVAELPLLVGVGLAEIDRADQLLETAKVALNADPSCGGAVVHLRVTSQENWRVLSVAGADVLAADLILTIQM